VRQQSILNTTPSCLSSTIFNCFASASALNLDIFASQNTLELTPGAVLVVDPNTGGALVVAPKVKALDPPEAAPVLAPNVNPELAGCVAGTAVAPNANAEFAGAAGAVVAPNANAEFAGAAGAKVAPKAKPDPALPVPAAAPV
jgi:hypothetical protein